MWLDPAPMTTEELLRLTNRNMVAFDLALGSSALLAAVPMWLDRVP